MRTGILPARDAGEIGLAVERAVGALAEGEVVALPTETVYGLGADALNPNAVTKIFEAKERPRFDPLIVHLPGEKWLERLACWDEPSQALLEKLIGHFWPGPLTLVLPRRDVVPDLVAAGLPTVALRMSAHPVFSEILRTLDRPVAAPSANRFGRISPTTAEHVREELDGRIPLIVDAGATIHGIESTIVALADGRMKILRRGPIALEELRAFGEVEVAKLDAPLQAPGQLPTHYAPRTPVRLFGQFVRGKEERVGLLGWRGSITSRFEEVRTLSPSGDLREAAANLFRMLRELDHANLDLIVAEELPEEGLGAAIMDRLRRAAASNPDARGRPE